MMRGLLSWVQGLPQPARFLLAGGIAAGVNWLVRFPLSVIVPFLPAVLIAAGIGMLVGFITYREFVFPRSPRPILLQLRDFVGVNLVALLAVTALSVLLLGLMSLLTSSVVLAEAVAHGLAIAMGAVLNYLGHSMITFGRSGRSARALPGA